MTEVRRQIVMLLQRTKAKFVAARVGVGASAVSQWASGRTEPSASHLAALRRNYPDIFVRPDVTPSRTRAGAR